MKRTKTVFLCISVAGILAAGIVLAEEAREAAPNEGSSAEDQARRNTPIAVVNGVKLTVGDFEDRLNKQGPFRRVQYSTPEKRREFLDEMIDWELQAQEAERRDLDEDESVQQQVKRVMSSLLLRREVDEQVTPEAVSDEEMQAYYQEQEATFKRPERVRAYHIVIADREKAQNLLKRILDDEVDTREFRRLAREMSEDEETKRRGGDLRYFTKAEERGEDDPEVHPAIVKATFDLLQKRRAAQARASKSAGQKTRPGGALPGFNPVYPKLVETPAGFHIVRFMGHRDKVDRSFEDVERQIRNRIWREKLQKAREDFIGGLREKHSVSVNEDFLGLVKAEEAPVGRRRGGLEGRLNPRKMPGPGARRPGGGPAGPAKRGP